MRRATIPLASPAGRLFAGMFLDIVDRLSDSLNLLSLFVGDRQFKLVLELHHQLNRIQRVGVEIVDEMRLTSNLALVDAHLFADDFNYLLFNVFHRLHLTCHSSPSPFPGPTWPDGPADYTPLIPFATEHAAAAFKLDVTQCRRPPLTHASFPRHPA